MTRISFIMPTFNRARFIGESIASVAAEMGADDELIVINDGSTDETGQVVRSLGLPVRYERQENAGKSVALNRALCMARGHYIGICDDDDLLRPGAAATLLARLDRTGADFVFGRYTRFRIEDGAKRDLGTGYWPDLTQGSPTRHILEDSFVMHNAALVRREAYDRVGPFDETMLRSLDYEMFVRLAVHCRPAFADAIVFEQRKHEGARGPARALHSAWRSDAVWKQFDRRIFERLRQRVGIGFYEALFDGADEARRRRAALLQRATIMARHDLWPEAIDDLAAAASCDAAPLGRLERVICRRAVAGKHGIGGALEGDTPARLRALRCGSASGSAVVDSLLDGLAWQMRSGFAEVRGDARALLRRVGGAVAVTARWARRKLGGTDRPENDLLNERREVPPFPIDGN